MMNKMDVLPQNNEKQNEFWEQSIELNEELAKVLGLIEDDTNENGYEMHTCWQWCKCCGGVVKMSHKLSFLSRRK